MEEVLRARKLVAKPRESERESVHARERARERSARERERGDSVAYLARKGEFTHRQDEQIAGPCKSR